MSIAAVVGRGYGPDASIAFIVTRGYSLGTTPPPPTELPGHGDYPRHLRKRSVKPVWDRLPDVVPASEPLPNLPREFPLVEARKPDLNPGDYEGLARLVAPGLPKRAEPKVLGRKKQRAARVVVEEPAVAPAMAIAALVEGNDTGSSIGVVETRARGSGTDIDSGIGLAAVDAVAVAMLSDVDMIIGRGRTAIVGVASLAEDADTVTASATWDDDELALSLLLGEME